MDFTQKEIDILKEKGFRMFAPNKVSKWDKTGFEFSFVEKDENGNIKHQGWKPTIKRLNGTDEKTLHFKELFFDINNFLENSFLTKSQWISGRLEFN